MPLPGETAFHATYNQRASRLTTFFRYFMAIPHFFVLFVYGIAAWVGVVLAWFAIIITGRYPSGLYALNAGFVRYTARLNGYYLLLTDRYPPFNGAEDPAYPVDLQIGEPLASYSRLSALVRIFPLIAAYVVAYVLTIVLYLLAFIAWFVVVLTGRLPRGMHGAMASCLSYVARTTAYAFLLTETFPGFDGTTVVDGADAVRTVGIAGL